jgi:hypothetical protein
MRRIPGLVIFLLIGLFLLGIGAYAARVQGLVSPLPTATPLPRVLLECKACPAGVAIPFFDETGNTFLGAVDSRTQGVLLSTSSLRDGTPIQEVRTDSGSMGWVMAIYVWPAPTATRPPTSPTPVPWPMYFKDLTPTPEPLPTATRLPGEA